MKEPSSGQAGNGDQAPTEPEQLISLAQAYFASDFPNPERTGCPAPGRLNAIARSGQLPDDELQAHLFGCSECFREFRVALAARPQIAPDVSWWSRLIAAFTLRPGFALAGVIAVIGLLAAPLVWRMYVKPPEPGIVQKIPDAAGTSTAPDQSPGSALPTATPNAPTQPAGQAAESQIAAVLVRVDLDDYPVRREAIQPDGGGKPIRLPRSRLRLRLRLPERSAAGRYQIRIVDAADNSQAEGTGSSRDGTSLTVSLDLSRLAERTYRLSIAHAGEAPDYYPMVVTGARAAPKSRP